jgi:hypothetical protein
VKTYKRGAGKMLPCFIERPAFWSMAMKTAKFLAEAFAFAIGFTVLQAPAYSATFVDDGSFTITASLPGTQVSTAVPWATWFGGGATGYQAGVGSGSDTVTVIGGIVNENGSLNPVTGTAVDGYPSYRYWLAASNGNSVTYSFSTPEQYFGLLWGSIDPTNTVTFFNGANAISSYTGAQIVTANIGAAYYPAAGSYVNFFADGPSDYFTSVVLSETTIYFEVQNEAAGINAINATPLPSTWLMLLSGFVGLGFLAYRGTKKRTALAVA